MQSRNRETLKNSFSQWLLVFFLFICGFSVYVFYNYPIFLKIEALFIKGEITSFTLWSLFYLSAAILFLSFILVLKDWKLWFFCFLVFFSVLANVIFRTTITGNIDPDVYSWLIDQRSSFGDAFTEYERYFLSAGIKVAVGFALLLLCRAAFIKYLANTHQVLRQRTSIIAITFVFLAIHLVLTIARPDRLPAESNMLLMWTTAFSRPQPQPQAITSVPQIRSDIEKIILIVDESIRPDILHKVVGSTIKKLPVIDYGEAASTVNCSSEGQALLRWGLDRNRIDTNSFNPRITPYIWGFAKKAGYRTVMIEGQTGTTPMYYINATELAFIDEWVAMPRTMETDMLIADELEKRLKNNQREFIYVTKIGAHFPYEKRYPRGYLSDKASRTDKYEAAVKYNTGRFFERLKGLDYNRAVILYTSDHGEQLDGVRLTHCSSNPTWKEYSVPMMVVTRVDDIFRTFSKNMDSVVNRTSHEQIFPTLLYIMGYSRLSEARYAPPLFQKNDQYHVLLYPHTSLKTPNRDNIEFGLFRHFPYR